MVLKLHGADVSPPVRSSLLTLRALGLNFELNTVNTMTGDHFSPEFLKINPLHTIPALEDGHFAIWDSHAINAYLVGKYGKDDSLYPRDLHKRAVIDQRLHYDSGVLFNLLRTTVLPVLKQGAKVLDKQSTTALITGYTALEGLLERGKYVAGDQLSIADFSIVTTITTSNLLVPIESHQFPKITEWIEMMQALPYYAEANQAGLDHFAAIVKNKMA